MKFNLTLCYTIIPLLLGLTFVAHAAVPSNIDSFIDDLNQKAVIQQQENQEALQKFQSIAKNSSQPNKISSELQKPDDSTETINCDESNEYNYPSNFVYDENHHKIYRLRPHLAISPTASMTCSMSASSVK